MKTPVVYPLLIALLSSWLLSACHRAPATVDEELLDGGTESFQFQTVSGHQVQIFVYDDKGPVAGSAITVRGVARSPDQPSEILWVGATDESGIARGSVTLPVTVSDVEVIVQKAGYRGPYSDESLRAQHGPTAPTSWQQVPAIGIAKLDISLESRIQ